MTYSLSQVPPEWLAVAFFAVGVCVGNLLVKPIVRWTDGRPLWPPLVCPTCSIRYPWWMRLPIVGSLTSRACCKHRIGRWALTVELGTGLLFAGYIASAVWLDAHDRFGGEVRPSEFGFNCRVFYHLALIALLVAATGTDFRDYMIPDAITVPGMLLGVVAATASGDLQLMHLWVDWNIPTAREFGPDIPQWIKQHPHWHGFAVSVVGLLVGGGTIWLTRTISSLVLDRESLGFGDVTLMAMIGSFLGWQPMVFVFLLAPLCGMFAGLAVRLVSGKTYVTFGPYLALAALVVLYGWRWIWGPTKSIFGDWLVLSFLSAAALVAFVVLLGLLRLYRAIPVTRHSSREHASTEDAETELPTVGE